MANADVISAVSETLEARLTAALSTLGNPPPTAQLHDLVTDVPTDPPTVTLFLYQLLRISRCATGRGRRASSTATS